MKNEYQVEISDGTIEVYKSMISTLRIQFLEEFRLFRPSNHITPLRQVNMFILRSNFKDVM